MCRKKSNYKIEFYNSTADATATDWNAVAVDYNHYPSTQYANSGPYGTSIGATYEYGGGVNDHRSESPGEDKVLSNVIDINIGLFI